MHDESGFNCNMPMSSLISQSDAGVLQEEKSMMPVCYCGEHRSECSACGKGFSQEVAAGRSCPSRLRSPRSATWHNDGTYFVNQSQSFDSCFPALLTD